MSVVELLKQVKALPAREREKLFLAILALDEDVPVQAREVAGCGGAGQAHLWRSRAAEPRPAGARGSAVLKTRH